MILKKEFYFIRHGQTDGNIAPSIKTNHGDISLNETGVAQAHRIEHRVSSLPIKTICCSPLKRAKETKEICCARLSAQHHEIHDLTECNSVIWQKMTSLGEEAHKYPEEPVYGFMQRALSGINQALSKEGPVLIVAHGGIHWAACCFMKISHEGVIDNCGLVHFSISETGQWQAKKLLTRGVITS
jgi:probable phosphoglycerate mutase